MPLSPDDAITALMRTAKGLVNHWYEFGPEYGFDEWVDGLDRALKILAIPPKDA